MGTGKIIQADNIEGVKAAKNFIGNSLAAINTSGWATYKDAAGTRPVDGTGGSPALVSFTRSTTSPLDGAASFLFSVTGGSSAQGEGASYDFTIDAAYKAKVLKIEADYIVNSGTFVAGSSTTDSDVIVYIYDVTNSTLIEPSSFKFLSNSTSISDKFQGTFQTSSDSTSYRLIFHVASTSTAAYALKIDNVSVSPSQYVYGTPITDWQSYTPTIAHNSGTATNYTTQGRWRRVGDSLEVTASMIFTSATVGTWSGLFFGIPSGMLIDTSKFSSSGTYTSVGNFSIVDAGTTVYPGTNVYFSTVGASVGCVVYTSAAAYSDVSHVSNTVPMTATTNDIYMVNFKVPILGWSSSVQMSDSADTRVVNFMGTSAGTVLTANVTNVAFTTVKDSHGAWSSNTYTVPVPGDYQVGIGLVSPSTSSFYVYYGTGGTSIKFIGYSPSTAGSSGYILLPNLKAGDIIAIRNNVSQTLNASTDQHLSISRISGPSAIAATETVAALYTGAPPTGTLGAAWNTVTYGTKVKDSHGAYASGTYTIQTAGQYDISAQVVISSASQAVGDFFGISIFIDGVESHTGAWNAQTTVTSVPARPKVDIKAIPLRGGQLVTIRSYAQSNTPIFVTSATQNFFSITRSGGY